MASNRSLMATQPILEKWLGDLRTSDESTRYALAKVFTKGLAKRQRDLTSAGFAEELDSLAGKLSVLAGSMVAEDCFAAITGTACVASFGLDDGTLAFKLVTLLTRTLSCGNVDVADAAASVYAGIVAREGVDLAAHVDSVLVGVREAFTGPSTDYRILASCSLLRELASAAPDLIIDRLQPLMEGILSASTSSALNVRQAAARALAPCLTLAVELENAQSVFGDVWIRIKEALAHDSVEHVHSALLCLREAIVQAGVFFKANYMSMTKLVFEQKGRHDLFIRAAFVSLLPALASLDPARFVAHFLAGAMGWLIEYMSVAQKDDMQSCMRGIGQIALSVSDAILPYVDPIVRRLEEGLIASQQRLPDAPAEAALFDTIGMLANAIGPQLAPSIERLLDRMLSCGLSASLVAAMSEIAANLPLVRSKIQERLLSLLAVALTGDDFCPPGVLRGADGAPVSPPASPSPRPLLVPRGPRNPPSTQTVPHRSWSTSSHRSISKQHDPKQRVDQDDVILAFQVLKSFDFDGLCLSYFVSADLLGYIGDGAVDIRAAAVASCCSRVGKEVIEQCPSDLAMAIRQVLDAALKVAVTDTEPALRELALTSIETSFDKHLARPEYVALIANAFNDDSFPVRLAAAVLLGRCTSVNPAIALPCLRKALIGVFIELEYSDTGRSRMDSARLIASLLPAAGHAARPLVRPLLKLILTRAENLDDAVACSLMLALNELNKIAGDLYGSIGDDVINLLMAALSDRSPTTAKLAALKALASLASNAGIVVPFNEKPTLLPLLLDIIRTESNQDVRSETLRVLGFIGALDPYSELARNALTPANTARPEANQQRDEIIESVLVAGPTSESGDYWLFFTLQRLITIVKDASLTTQHVPALEAAMIINRTLRTRCAPFWPELMPALLCATRNRALAAEIYLSMLSSLIGIMGEFVGPHVSLLIEHITETWTWQPGTRPLLIEIIEKVAFALGGRFRAFLKDLMPFILQAFEQTWPFNDEAQTVTLRLRVLKCLRQLGPVLDDHLHLVVPLICKTMEMAEMPNHVRLTALQTIKHLVDQLNFGDHASAVIHSLLRVMDEGPSELQSECMEALYVLARSVDRVYEPFIDMVEDACQRGGLHHEEHTQLVQHFKAGLPLPPHLSRHPQIRVTNPDVDPAADAGVARQPLNWSALHFALETREWNKAADWKAWLKRLSHVLLRTSPVFPLRACASMAENYNSLAKDLFGPAFLSIYVDLSTVQQGEVVRAIEAVFLSQTAPSEVRGALLNMIEHSERFDKIFPIAVKDLGGYAITCHAYAKALHYKELECLVDPTPRALEDLVEINHALEQQDVAGGLLSMARETFHAQPKEEWYERLERWDEALVSYEDSISRGDGDSATELGRMRCLSALAQWEPLAIAAHAAWPSANEEMRDAIAPLGAAAAWGRGTLEDLSIFMPALQKQPLEHSWFSAVLAVHENKPAIAYRHLDLVRTLLDGELATQLGESYTRAYRNIVRAQMCSELEEVIEHKVSPLGEEDRANRRSMIHSNWTKRLDCVARDVEVWRLMLNIHLLVQTPREISEQLLQFADLARRTGRLHTSAVVLNLLLSSESGEDDTTVMRGTPSAIYSRIKLMFDVGEKEEAIAHLKDLAVDLSAEMLPLLETRGGSRRALATTADPEKSTLLARIYRKISYWQTLTLPGHDLEPTAEVIKNYEMAIKLRPEWSKPFHSLAVLHETTANAFLRKTAEHHKGVVARDRLVDEHVVPAIRAFYRALSLTTGTSAVVLQDTLRLLSLLFNFGTHDDVVAAIQEGIAGVRVELWLSVIPQLQARLFTSAHPIRRCITQILGLVGKTFPQSIIYPLAVSSQYPNRAKRKAATMLLDRLRDHSPKIVEQGLLIGRELVRVAILWHEMWHEGLDDASRLYYNDRNLNAMWERLEPLHAMMLQKGAETMREIAFEQSFGQDLKDAYDLGRRYRQTNNIDFLSQAWGIYYAVFKRINATLTESGATSIDLLYAAPKLLDIKDTEIAVPGTFSIGREPVRIQSFARILDVLNSKQHPRKLKILGSDGQEYTFLLKGHEDIRQDERVMQFFGLVNSLLAKDRETSKRRLCIQTFSVVPLSTNSGLIGWVPYTDTMHVLIRDYRQKRGILFDLELKLMLQTSPTKYEKLSAFQQLEVFEYAMQHSSGQDLYRILWLKAASSEVWLERRTTYTRSLAVMSMTGYILGLGDRHPCNLLLLRNSGQAMHVDFGDCFEIAINRERYPETVPFRLTRMLVQAMEVSGVDGTFRTVCERTMQVLREERESLLALLSAFAWDPLVNWRILEQRPYQRVPPSSPSTAAHATHGVDSPSTFSLDKRAVDVIDRVKVKLLGRDFGEEDVLTVPVQVDKLIKQARSSENLARMYLGWCAFCGSLFEASINLSCLSTSQGDTCSDTCLWPCEIQLVEVPAFVTAKALDLFASNIGHGCPSSRESAR